MPSLRRTASSPAVRAAPYALSVARGNGHRRSSGSETSSRRVLADIEWWRVTDGQCDHDSDDPQRASEDTLPLAAAAIHIAYVDPAVDSLPWTGTPAAVSDETTAAYALPTAQFSSLSITPHSPTRRHPSLDSAPSSPASQSSSLVSSPGPVHTPIDGPTFDIDMGFLDASLLALPNYRRSSRYGALALAPSAPGLRRSFTECLALKEHDDDDTASTKQCYADFAVSPLSSAPDFLN